jgi:2'-5' RNA ligase
MVASKIKLINLYYSLLFILGLSNFALDARKMEVLIAIPVSGNRLKSLNESITTFQEQIKKSADAKGYDLNTSFAIPDQMHITLEHITEVDETLVDSYIAGARLIAAETKPFDITPILPKAHFELLGKNNEWGVLRLPTAKTFPLYVLAYRIKNCIEGSGLKPGIFSEFKAHISIGKFLGESGKLLPKIDNLDWLPKIDFRLSQEPLVVDTIVVMVREKIKDNTAGTMEFINMPKHFFLLGSGEAKEKVVCPFQWENPPKVNPI